jgi:hypothetical protein
MLDFQGRLLQRAAEICGDLNALSSRLAVSRHALGLWIDGKARLPEQVFLSAADIVLEDDVARAAQDRRARPRVVAIPDSAANEEPNAA